MGGKPFVSALATWSPVGVYYPILDDLLQKVVTNVDVLGAIVEFWVFGDHNSGLVVNVEDSGGRGVEAKLREELPQPYSFLGSMGSRNVLRLCAGQGDGRLLLGAPAYSSAC